MTISNLTLILSHKIKGDSFNYNKCSILKYECSKKKLRMGDNSCQHFKYKKKSKKKKVSRTPVPFYVQYQIM